MLERFEAEDQCSASLLVVIFHFLFVDAVIQGYRLYFVVEFLGDGFGEAAMLSKCVPNFTAFNTLCSNAIGCENSMSKNFLKTFHHAAEQ